MLPGPRPRPELKPNRTRGLVRRATPFLAIAAVIALQAALGERPVLVFPLYLGAVLLTAIYASRPDSLLAAVLAAIGVSAPSILRGTAPSDIEEALREGATMILLDNMGPEQLRRAVEICAGRAQLEASGGITLENVRVIAETGVDRISIGGLTKDIKAPDLSMRFI